jgi:hypothetical protein
MEARKRGMVKPPGGGSPVLPQRLLAVIVGLVPHATLIDEEDPS